MSEARTPFELFGEAQIHVNDFLWSAEIGLALVDHRILSDPTLNLQKRVHALFGDLEPKPHAFVLNTKGSPKYTSTAQDFRGHMKEDFESLCRYVILRFHSALELFIWLRCKPYLGLQGKSAKDIRKIKDDWLKSDYRQLGGRLSALLGKPIEIDHHIALQAQAFRLLRNTLVHLQEDTFFDQRWTDAEIVAKIRRTFHGGDLKHVEKALVQKIQGMQKKTPAAPTLFFYALFLLTDYRKLAKAVEDALVANGFPATPSAASPDPNAS
jgi:hypothetical protein